MHLDRAVLHEAEYLVDVVLAVGAALRIQVHIGQYLVSCWITKR